MKFLHGKKKQKLSFEFVNNVIIIPINLNGKKLSFILDTGAKNTILFGSSSSDSLVLNNQSKIKIRGIGGGKSINAIESRNNRIKIKNIYAYNQKVLVLLDDSFDLSLKMGHPIHGIIGYELFKNFVVSINFNTKKLKFTDPKYFSKPKSNKYEKFELEFYQYKPYITAEAELIDNSKYQTKLLIDTGCSDALWFFENNKTGFHIKNNFFIDYLGEGISGSIFGKRTKIKSFKIGNYTFNKVTAAFLDSTSTIHARRFKERNGSIGSGLLERFRVIIDYPHKNIYLKKAKSFKNDFKYNRAGIGVAYHKDAKVICGDNNEAIIISDNIDGVNKELFKIVYGYSLKRLFYIYYVRPDSPADKAGLKPNDIIQKINGKQFHEYKLEEIIGLFYGDKGEIISISINRGGYPFYFEFKLDESL
jgi:predicted aspartyl protease